MMDMAWQADICLQSRLRQMAETASAGDAQVLTAAAIRLDDLAEAAQLLRDENAYLREKVDQLRHTLETTRMRLRLARACYDMATEVWT
jgi:hypothetical protein